MQRGPDCRWRVGRASFSAKPRISVVRIRSALASAPSSVTAPPFCHLRRTVQHRTMIDWDDVRFFLAVARGGSVRAAAVRLGVNHATVLRRIAQLEERLGVHMFEKLPSGYRLTAAGEEVLEFADQMEASLHL